MHIDMPQGAYRIIEKLNDNGFEAYIVGGCVRDSLRGKVPSDWDICTSAKPEEMVKIFQDKKLIPTGIQHGTLTILEHDGAYEVTTFRIDGEYKDHRRPEQVAFTAQLKEDLSRRDFTINAMAWHPQKGIIDLFGGVTDLENRIVRAVGMPRKRFDEDGLRMLRMVRFATVLGFDYDHETYQAAKNMSYLLQHISKERIQVEFNKILISEHVSRGLQDLYDLGMYAYFLPEVCHQVGFVQDGGHHFLDVFEHALLATGLIENELVLRLAMFLHDIGKPFSWVEKETHDSFPNHAEVGGNIANKLLRDLKYDNQTRKQVAGLVAHHNDYIENNDSSIRQCLATLGEIQTRRLLKIKVADLLAHDMKAQREDVLQLFYEIEQRLNTIVERGDCYSIKQLAINGKDLMAIGYHGTAIGEALDDLLAKVIQEPTLNQKISLLKLLR